MNDNNRLATTKASPLGGFGVFVASSSNFAEILEIQKKAFLSEAELYQNFNIQPLVQTLEDMMEECKDKVVLKAIVDETIIGSVRANMDGENCWVNKLVVLPEYQRRGLGKKLLREIEIHFPEAKKFTLATGLKSKSNIRLYQKVGYQIVSTTTFEGGIEAVVMEKTNDIRKP
jgi:ribosomal protein S18 acetylase RimI-like enzyme